MRSSIARITLKIIEVLSCVACFLTKIITDLEARRVFLRNQKFSREWGLLHNVTWSSAGNSFANVTYGGYSLITTLILISRCIDAKSRPSLTEKIFLIVGMLCFFAMGGIVLAAYDQVPADLHDNSLILGCLSFFTALVMLFDLADPLARHVSDTTQTDSNLMASNDTQTANVQTISSSTNNEIQPRNENPTSANNNITIDERESNVTTQVNKHSNHEQKHPNHEARDVAQNGNYHRSDSVDFVQTHHLPRAEQPVFERILLPEKKRPVIERVPEVQANHVQSTSYSDHYRNQSHQHSQPHHRKYSPPPRNKARSSHNYYSYDEYDDNFENLPPRYVLKSNALTASNRYRDLSRSHNNNGHPAPMMVIRNYGHSYVAKRNDSHRPKQASITGQSGRDMMYNGNPKQNAIAQQRYHSDDETVDFHKMNSVMRPGFVANAAKMWDERVAQQSEELNTIV